MYVLSTRRVNPYPAEVLKCLFLFFIHWKLELLKQFPASNDEKYVFNEK